MIRTTTLGIAPVLAAGSVHAQKLDGRLKKIAGANTVTIANRSDATPLNGNADAFASDELLLIGTGLRFSR